MNLCMDNKKLKRIVGDDNKLIHGKNIQINQLQDQLHVLQQKYDELNSKFDKVVKQYKEYKQRQDRKHILKEQLDHILECLRNDELTNEMYHKLMICIM